jgi:hypothetical protein
MKSITHLLATILSIPHVELSTHLRAQIMLNRINGHSSGFGLGSIFGAAR